MAEKYYPALLDIKPAGNNKFFVKNNNDNQITIINKPEGEFLNTLTGCRTAKEHLEEIMESENFNISRSVIADMINKWINKGFLRNENLLFRYSNQEGDRDKNKLISGCITSNRPEMLNRWLKLRTVASDYINNKTSIVICDDTQNKKILSSNIKTVEYYRKKYSGDIFYYHEERKTAYLKKIKQMLPAEIPEHVPDFSLSINHNLPGRRTPGTNRNSLFLLTAGSNLYTSDDDIEYRFFSRPVENKKYSFPDSKTLTAEFFPDLESCKNSLIFKENIELINQLDELINSNAKTLLADNNSEALKNITPQTAMLLEKKLLKIKAICLGYLGGRWYESPYLPLLKRNNDKNFFFDDYEKYSDIKNKGLNLMAAEKYTIVSGDTLMGGTLCLNNQDIIPPCLPQGMRDDTCLSLLLSSCLEPSLSLYIPSALFHNPAEKKPFSENDFNIISANMGDYTIMILEKISSILLLPKGKERLKEIGFHLKELSGMKTSLFEEHLKILQLGFFTKKMDYICYLLNLYNEEPSWWADDMKKYYRLLKEEALSSYSVVPRELRRYESKNKALDIFKDYIFKCGELLEWWPEIWGAARNLNMEGRGLIKLSE